MTNAQRIVNALLEAGAARNLAEYRLRRGPIEFVVWNPDGVWKGEIMRVSMRIKEGGCVVFIGDLTQRLSAPPIFDDLLQQSRVRYESIWMPDAARQALYAQKLPDNT
jgi:hypothetical protein